MTPWLSILITLRNHVELFGVHAPFEPLFGIDLPRWVEAIRVMKALGELTPRQVAEIEDIHGWNW